MRIIQFTDSRLGRCLGVVRKDEVENVTLRDATFTSTHAAFCKARKKGQRLENYLENLLANPAHSAPLKLADLLASGSVLAPVTEEPGSRLLISGTGLTHLGSVEQRLIYAQGTAPAEASVERVDRRTFLIKVGGATAAITVAGAVVGELAEASPVAFPRLVSFASLRLCVSFLRLRGKPRWCSTLRFLRLRA